MPSHLDLCSPLPPPQPLLVLLIKVRWVLPSVLKSKWLLASVFLHSHCWPSPQIIFPSFLLKASQSAGVFINHRPCRSWPGSFCYKRCWADRAASLQGPPCGRRSVQASHQHAGCRLPDSDISTSLEWVHPSQFHQPSSPLRGKVLWNTSWEGTTVRGPSVWMPCFKRRFSWGMLTCFISS